jgi:exosortase
VTRRPRERHREPPGEVVEAVVQQDAWQKLNMRTVVLVGSRDFGRCPLAARLPAALWPIGDTPALRRLLDHLAAEGIADVTVCCGEDVRAQVERICAGTRPRATLVVEDLVRGTAGCLRDAAGVEPSGLWLIFSSSMMAPPPVSLLVEGHQASGADLTVVFNPGEDAAGLGSPAEIYLGDAEVLSRIPSGGYSDIKEGLIPAIVRSGGTVHPLRLEREVGNFRDRRGYIDALAVMFRDHPAGVKEGSVPEGPEGGPVLQGRDVSIHPTARICGPVIIGDHARLAEGAVVVGPASLGRNTVLGANSVVIRSTLWADAAVGARCEIRESIIALGLGIPDGAEVVERALCADRQGPRRETERGQSMQDRVRRIGVRVQSGFDILAGKLPAWAPLSSRQLEYLAGGLLILAVLLWSYWPTWVDLKRVWLGSDEYSSGLLVPPLAAYVLWSRRREIAAVELRPAVWAGGAVFLLAQLMRGEGLYRMYLSAERLSLILSLTGLVLLVMGWKHLGRLASVLVFLCLMLPWPHRIQTAVTLPLQSWSTSSAVFCLELAGYDVQRDGNVIHIGAASVAVAEACNGLRMVTAFFVISGLVVLLVRRSWWEKLVLLVSSLPVALLCNTLRLATTAVLFTVVKGEVWEKRFHDWGGYAMMPLALAIVVGELWLLAQLTTPPMETRPVIIARRPAQRVPDP